MDVEWAEVDWVEVDGAGENHGAVGTAGYLFRLCKFLAICVMLIAFFNCMLRL
jgi:hypothetical protein